MREAANEGNDAPAMDRMAGQWHQIKGRLREKWGDLTDDDLERLKGQREQIVGLIQARSGRERAEVERDLDSITRDAQFAW